MILSIDGNGVSFKAMRMYTQKASVLRVNDIIKKPSVLDGPGVFKEEGVWQYIKVGEYNLDLIPIDNDILTMELPLSFDQFTEDNKSSLFDVAALDLKD